MSTTLAEDQARLEVRGTQDGPVTGAANGGPGVVDASQSGERGFNCPVKEEKDQASIEPGREACSAAVWRCQHTEDSGTLWTDLRSPVSVRRGWFGGLHAPPERPVGCSGRPMSLTARWDGSVLIRMWKKLVRPAVIKHMGLCSVCPYSVCDQGLPE